MKADTRHKIISTASELFYQNGYNLTGINEIIEQSGIAKATLYSHFKSKEDLLLAYLDYRDEELLKTIEAFCLTKTKGNQRLLAVLEFLVPFFNQEDFNGCWCIRSVAEIPRENQRVRAKIKHNKNKFHGFLKHLVEQNQPGLNPDQQAQLANQLYLLYEGALMESHLQGAAWPIETAIHTLKGILQQR